MAGPSKEELEWYRETVATTKRMRRAEYASPKARKKASGPRSSPKLQQSVHASKKGVKPKSSAAKKAAAKKRAREGAGPKSNPAVRSAAYYARKRYAAALKKKK